MILMYILKVRSVCSNVPYPQRPARVALGLVPYLVSFVRIPYSPAPGILYCSGGGSRMPMAGTEYIHTYIHTVPV